MAKKLFNKFSAVLSCLMFTLSIQILVIDTLTLSEPLFHFFTVTLFYYYFKEKYSKLDSLLLSFCIIALCLTRMEGWVLCGIFFLANLFQRKKMRAAILFFSTAFSVLYWEVLSFLNGRKILQTLFFSDYEVINIYKINGWDNFEIIWRASIGFTMLTLPILFIGYIFCRKNTIRLHYFILTILFLSPALYKLFTKSLFAEFRYFTIYALLLFPVSSFAINQWLKNTPKKIRYIVTSFILLIAIIIDYNWIYTRFQLPYHMHLKDGFKESASYFKSDLNISDHTIYIDFDNSWSRDLWMSYSDVSIRSNKGVCRVESHNWLGEYFSQESVEKCLSKNNKFYLFLLPNGLLNKYISQNLDMLKSKYNIKLIKNFNEHKIIELNYKNN